MPLKDQVEPLVVRALLNTEFTALDLPDGIIQLDVYAGAAAREVIQRVSDAESRTGQDAQHVLNALNLLTAALIADAGVITQYTRLKESETDTGLKDEDWPSRVPKLRSRAYDELAIVLDQTGLITGQRSSMAVSQRGVPCALLKTLRN